VGCARSSDGKSNGPLKGPQIQSKSLFRLRLRLSSNPWPVPNLPRARILGQSSSEREAGKAGLRPTEKLNAAVCHGERPVRSSLGDGRVVHPLAHMTVTTHISAAPLERLQRMSPRLSRLPSLINIRQRVCKYQNADSGYLNFYGTSRSAHRV